MPKQLEPFPGADTLTAELWTGKKGVAVMRGNLGVEDAKLVMAYASLPFDSSGNLKAALVPLLEKIARLYSEQPDDCLRVMQTVLAHMRSRSRVSQAVAADTTSPASAVVDQWRLPVYEQTVATARKRLRRSMRKLREDEASE